MGFCSKRHFLLTICTLQLFTTVERQVFDFLGFMWGPILVNFFNIIFVILGFFGAFQYQIKYLITYCLWDILWLGWNIFCICFYLEIGGIDKMSDVLNFGTGSLSWWQANGPGCKAIYDVTQPEFYPPTNVTDCILNYKLVEVIHASTQCILAFLAIIGGICLSKTFMTEEDDSFDFVGGGDLGLAGHTPLHPMYVSYSALPPPSSSSSNQNYTSFPRGSTTSSNNNNNNLSFYYYDNNNTTSTINSSILNNKKKTIDKQDTSKSKKSNNNPSTTEIIDDDYSNPVDHLHRPVSPPPPPSNELAHYYDSFDNKSARFNKYEKNNNQTHGAYSPIVSPVMRRAAARPSSSSQASRQNRNSYIKPRVFTDFIREQPLKSYYSDPRLAMEQQQQQQCYNSNDKKNNQREKRNSRPLSLYASKL